VYFFYPESELAMLQALCLAAKMTRAIHASPKHQANGSPASNLSLEEIDNLFLPVDKQVRGASISYNPTTGGGRRASYSSIGKSDGRHNEKV
jgi:hypothetical protein